MSVYTREARAYDRKHHFTTRGQDTVWRREAAWSVLNAARRATNRQIRVLDLCTGTGLTIVEITRLLDAWQQSADITGLDLNEAMLSVAKSRTFSWPHGRLRFARGDAASLPELPATVDIAVQVFGIGGIPDPAPVFKEILRVLREGGEYYLVDMHRPIPHLPGEWPFGYRWWRMPLFEATTYMNTTVPIALARLWGWRDTTLDFYVAPLTVLQDVDGRWYGFDIVWFKQETERWWFGLPLMPTARLLLRKAHIDEVVASQRQQSARALWSFP